MATASSQSNPPLLDGNHAKSSVRTGFVSDSIAAGVAFALILTVGQRIVGFGRGVLFCRLMTDQQLGQWSMAWSYLMLLAPLAVLGLPGCFGKFTEHFRQRGQLKTFVTRISWISLLMTLLMSGALLMFAERFAWILFRDPGQINLIRCLAVALAVVSVSNFLSTLLESLRQVRAVTIMRFLTGVMFALVGTLALMWWQDGSSAATLGFAISCLVGMVPGLWVLWKYRAGITNDGDPLAHSTMWKRIAPFAIWLWVSNLLSNLFEVSDRYMLIHWSNLSPDLAQGAVGQYHSGRVVPLLLISVAAMLGGVLMPYMSHAWESGKKRKAAKQLNWTVKLMSLTFTIGGVLILLLSPLLFDWILQGRYRDGLAILPMTLVYCIWFSLMTVGQDYLWVAEKGKWAALATAIGLVANIFFNMLLIPHFGLWGAVLATSLGNATIVTLIFALNQRFGCPTDLGIWLSAGLPMILLLSTPMACGAIVIVVAACIGTDWFLNAEEKLSVQKIVVEKLQRFLNVG